MSTPSNCDYLWMSSGGVLMDGTGDIALTTSSWQSTIDIMRSRIKATLNGWQLYPFGADLESEIGQAVEQEVQTQIQQRVTASLTYQFLPAGAFQVKTRAVGDTRSLALARPNAASRGGWRLES